MCNEHLLNMILEVLAHMLLIFRIQVFKIDWCTIFDDDLATMNPWEVIFEDSIGTGKSNRHDAASGLLCNLEAAVLESQDISTIFLIAVTGAFREDED